MPYRIFCILVLAGLALAACAPAPAASPTSAAPRVLTVMTHDSFAVSEQVAKAFENEYNVKLDFVKAGDAGTALNKAILSKDNPFADVFYGVDNTFLSRALNEGIYEPYDSPVLADIPAEFRLDPQDRALPVDYADVCLNYDKAYFSSHNLPVPQSLEDLTRPEYKGLLVVENPATSSPGLAFLLTTVGVFGDPGYLDFWKALVQNDVKVDDGWEEAYNTDFSGASGRGPRPIVLSYDSSPVAEIVYSQNPPAEPSTAALVADDTCFRQIEFVGILKGTKNLDLAKKWVDFMLSPTFQEDMPLQMFVFPVNPKAKLDPRFVKYLIEPKTTVVVSPDQIAAHRDVWIQAWRTVVLP